MTPFVHVLWPTSDTNIVLRTSVSSSTRSPNGTTLNHTHTLTNDAVAGDLVFFSISVDASTTTFTHSRGDMVLLAKVGFFRSTAYLYCTTVTSGDVAAGTISNTFTASASESFNCTSFEAAGLDPDYVQFAHNAQSENFTAVPGMRLHRVNEGSLVLGLAQATPDSGTVGLAVDALNDLASLHAPYTFYSVGGAMHHTAYLIPDAFQSVLGPSYTNDSATGPGNVTNVSLLEFRPTGYTTGSGVRCVATGKCIAGPSGLGSPSVELPLNRNGKLVLIALRHFLSSQAITPPSGWTLLATDSTDAHPTRLYYRVCDGTEDPAVTFTATTGGMSVTGAWMFDGVATGESSFIEAAVAVGSQDPPDLTPSWGSAANLWLAFYTSRYSDWSVSAYPTDYVAFDELFHYPVASNVKGGMVVASRVLAAASENPGAYTVTAPSGTLNSVAITVAIRPAA